MQLVDQNQFSCNFFPICSFYDNNCQIMSLQCSYQRKFINIRAISYHDQMTENVVYRFKLSLPAAPDTSNPV